jgi:DNA-binding NarL/FixJ family response regulator
LLKAISHAGSVNPHILTESYRLYLIGLTLQLLNVAQASVAMNIENNHQAIQVVLAEDHPYLRACVRQLLERDPTITVVGEATDGLEALDLVVRLQPDILILDIEMPNMNGLEVLRRLEVEDTSVRVLVLSSYSRKEFIKQMLRHGAYGYLLKDEAAEVVVRAIHEVFHGNKEWLSESVEDILHNDLP